MITLSTVSELSPVALILVVLLILLLSLSPVLWFIERSKRKYWQERAEELEKKLEENG